jgi:hypothetical protein
MTAPDTMGLLVIDPNGLRSTDPGPIFFKLDTLTITPGLTSRNGAFNATINDNKNASRLYDMTYLTPNSVYVRDNDEYWIGIQQGGSIPTDPSGLTDTWAPGVGGRQWLMGGFIINRSYDYDEDTRLTAKITGKDYTDLWRTQPFGTPTTPRNYSDDSYPDGEDIVTIINQLFDDVNTLQLVNWQFTKHAVLWPSLPLGTKWKKEFKGDDAFSLMVAACEELGYDWTIIVDPTGATPAERRRVVWFPRDSPLLDSTMRVAFELNIRSAPEIQVGDTSELVTNILIDQTDAATAPPDVADWMTPTAWPDRDVAARKYSAFTFPSPSNPANLGRSTAGVEPDASVVTDGEVVGYDKWSDYTQIIDDEGFPALNFRRAGLVGQNPSATVKNRTFKNFLSFATGNDGRPISTRMAMDLRGWRRLVFKFRHATRADREDITFSQPGTITVDPDFYDIAATQTEQYASDRNIWKVGNRLWAFYNKNTTYKDLYAASSTDGGATWGGEVQLTPTLTRSTVNDSVWVDGNRFHYARTDARTVGLGAKLYYRSGILNDDGTVTFTAAEVVLVTLYNQDSPTFFYSFPAKGCQVITDDYGNPTIFYVHEGYGYSVDQWYYSAIRSDRSDGVWNTSYTADGYRTTDIGAGVGFTKVARMGGAELYAIHSIGFSGGSYVKNLEGYQISAASYRSADIIGGYTGSAYIYGAVAGRGNGVVHVVYQLNSASLIRHKEIYSGGTVVDHGTIAFPYSINSRIVLTIDGSDNLYFIYGYAASSLRYAIRYNGSWLTGTISVTGSTGTTPYPGALPVLTDSFIGTYRGISNTILKLFTFSLPVVPAYEIGSPTELSTYRVRLHTNIDNRFEPGDWDRRAFVYQFGVGDQQSNGLGLDTVNTRYWHTINILLPELDDETGEVVNWNGWEPEYPLDGLSLPVSADPTSIDFVSLDLFCGELVLGTNIHGYNWLLPSNSTAFPDNVIPLKVNILAGSYYIQMDSPEQFFYRGEARPIIGAGTETELYFYDPKPIIFIADANLENGEWVQVEAINGLYPAPYNVKLTHPTQIDHYAVLPVGRNTVDYIWFPAEHSVSISQFRFQKNKALNISARGLYDSQYLYPYRYRLTSYTDVATPRDAFAKARQELSELGGTTQYIKVQVEGDPRFLMGYLVQPQFDPGRETLFHNISMRIDDVQYVVDGIDFYCDLTLGTIETRGRSYPTVRQQAAAIARSRTLEAGRKTSMFGRHFVL